MRLRRCLMLGFILATLVIPANAEHEYYDFEPVAGSSGSVDDPVVAEKEEVISSGSVVADEEASTVYEFVVYDTDTAAVALAAISDSYGVGTGNISIFGPVASKLPYGTHYVYWREGQYDYKLAYSEDLVFEGGSFTADSVTVITYTSGSGYNSQATFTTATERNFELDPGSYLVWSDLGDYPTLYERGEVDYAQLTCVMLASFGLFMLFGRLVACCCRR